MYLQSISLQIRSLLRINNLSPRRSTFRLLTYQQSFYSQINIPTLHRSTCLLFKINSLSPHRSTSLLFTNHMPSLQIDHNAPHRSAILHLTEQNIFFPQISITSLHRLALLHPTEQNIFPQINITSHHISMFFLLTGQHHHPCLYPIDKHDLPFSLQVNIIVPPSSHRSTYHPTCHLTFR